MLVLRPEIDVDHMVAESQYAVVSGPCHDAAKSALSENTGALENVPLVTGGCFRIRASGKEKCRRDDGDRTDRSEHIRDLGSMIRWSRARPLGSEWGAALERFAPRAGKLGQRFSEHRGGRSQEENADRPTNDHVGPERPRPCD